MYSGNKRNLDVNPSNLLHIWELDGVENTVFRADQDLYELIKAIIAGEDAKTVSKPSISNGNENIYQALADAELLIEQRGAAFAYDRMHNALHACLRQVCDNHSIAYDKNDAINALLPKINAHLKKMPDDGRNEKVFNMLRAANSMLDSINYLRNHNSLAHPTENLLNQSDAMFAINLTKSIMTYVDDLLS